MAFWEKITERRNGVKPGSELAAKSWEDWRRNEIAGRIEADDVSGDERQAVAVVISMFSSSIEEDSNPQENVLVEMVGWVRQKWGVDPLAIAYLVQLEAERKLLEEDHAEETDEHRKWRLLHHMAAFTFEGIEWRVEEKWSIDYNLTDD